MNFLGFVFEAIEFAIAAHGDQKRKDGVTPYMVHPVGVARLVAEAGCTDAAALMAAILHDVVEDTPVTSQEIEARFGADVSKIVSDLSDDKSLSKAERKRLTIEHAATLRYQSAIVKLADCTYNLRSLDEAPPKWTEERIEEYRLWLGRVVDALPLSRGQKSIFHP